MNHWIWGLTAYVLLLNGMTFMAFGYDKFAARRAKRRIPEIRLLGLAFLGGSPAAFLASHLFRHKTHKQPFRSRLWLIVVAQMILIAALLFAAGIV